MTQDTQGRVVYVRRRKRDAPRCPQCQRRYLAGSTQRALTYYYPACRCLVRSTKVPRQVAELLSLQVAESGESRVDRAA